MTPDTSKPDYSFIMDQPGPNLEAPKRSKKPLIFIGGMITIFVVLIGIALISKKSTNVQLADTSNQAQSTQFFKAIASKDATNALSYYNQADRPDEATFNKHVIDNYGKKVDFNSCIFQQDLGNVNNKGNNVVVFRCPMYKNPAEDYVDFYLGFAQSSDNSVRLKVFMIKDIKQ